jgi:hypothetical protein
MTRAERNLLLSVLLAGVGIGAMLMEIANARLFSW